MKILRFLMLFSVVSVFAATAHAEAPPIFLLKWGTLGNGDGQFNFPLGVAVDVTGDVYVVEQNNNHIQKFTNTGTFLTKWGALGSGDGQFTGPQSVAVGASGNTFVADNNQRIQKFEPAPVPVEPTTLGRLKAERR